MDRVASGRATKDILCQTESTVLNARPEAIRVTVMD